MLTKRDLRKIIEIAGMGVIAGSMLAAPFAAFGHDPHTCPTSCCADSHDGCRDGQEAECNGAPPCEACDAFFSQNATAAAFSSDHLLRRSVERHPWLTKMHLTGNPSPDSIETNTHLTDPRAMFGQSPPGFSGTVLRL